MEQEVMETVLHEILHELRTQKVQLDQLQSSMKKQEGTIADIHNKQAKEVGLPGKFSEEQLGLLKDFVGENLDALQKAIILNPAVRHTHKYFSLMPSDFRIEHFPLLVNTVMKWIVVLIVLIFLMWLTVDTLK